MAQPIKVLHINTWGTGGAGVACKRISKSLNDAGVDSKVLFLKNEIETKEWKSFAKIENGLMLFLKTQILRGLSFLPTLGNPVIYNNTLYSPFDVMKHPFFKEADVIHVHWVSKFMNWESVISKSGKPIILTMHDMYPFTGFYHYLTGLDWNRYKRVITKRKKKLKSLYHKNVIATAPSKWLTKLANESEVFKNEAVCIPNCIDTSVFKSLKREANSVYRILFVAENINEERKGFKLLLEALEKLPKELDYELLILGKGSFEIPKSKKLGFITDPNELVCIYNQADVFVTPSLEDNLPNTVLESLSCGTPVLGFNIGGIPDMVRHTENGYLIEEKTSEAIVEGLLWLKENRLPTDVVASIIEEKFSNRICSRNYIQLYNTLLS